MTSRKDNAPASEPSSPACSMHEADDVYMGYAGKDELTAILTELLEVERAGVRVAHESALTVRGGPLGELMRAIEKDEARWCAMLAGHLWITGWNSGDLFRYDSKSKTWARWHLPGDGP